ncbi:MAG: sulfur oxidation c-type cytochrome SoxA [Methylococcales bacterium]|nr:sulfur oxidation c-type cytochrome SoxA [Methylococcales bacterium]
MIIRLIYLCLLLPVFALNAAPLDDLQAFRTHYQQRFPQLILEDYADGLYAIDSISRQSWLEIELFPPYEFAIEAGKLLFETPLKEGVYYADCFKNKGLGIAHLYPLWSEKQGEVITLAKAINDCRVHYQLPKLAYQKGEITQLLAYMAYTSRGKKINITIPDKPKALAAYEQGKAYYYQRRGQLNFSCALCHVTYAGQHIRSEVLSPALGHTSGWPTYRLKWGEMGTLHRRFIECHQQIRATAPEAQSIELRNLDYFLTFMGQGVPINAPSTRR